jgi:predicted O-methyltransferase YrrM
MIHSSHTKIIADWLSFDAIIHDIYPGFREDYLVLHCLMRRHKPKTILEIGTHLGAGTNVICNAVPTARVMSLDLHPSESHKSLQHVSLMGRRVGEICRFPYEQIFADTLSMDFAALGNIDAWYIDGEHDTKHVLVESLAAIASSAKLIVWHDTDMPPVMDGIQLAFANDSKYKLVRVDDTRITYAEKA